MEHPHLSVVIPTYNSGPLVIRALQSLELQTAKKADFEVIVVDDGSTDPTSALLKSYQGSSSLSLKILYVPHGGPGAARNRGVHEASAHWVAFMDADTVASPEWIGKALSLMEEYPHAGGFEGRTTVSNRKAITPFTHQTENLYGGRYPTCNLILRKGLCQFHLGYKIAFREDSDLAFSILEAGYQIYFSPKLVIDHPPLPGKYSRPLSLAKRYYYDGLLQARFPERYRHDLDSHSIAGLTIPHLRRKIYSGFILTQLLLGASLFSMNLWILLMASGLVLLGYLAVLRVQMHGFQRRNLQWKEVFTLLGLALLTPWVLTIQKLRGDFAFRHEPQFSKEKWLRRMHDLECPEDSSHPFIKKSPLSQGIPMPLSMSR